MGKQTDPRLYLCLGMCWNHPRDRLRLRSLNLLSPGTRVISFSENKCVGPLDFRKMHVQINLKKDGHQDILDRLAIELNDTPKAHVTVVLDYFWFQGGYYSSNYGVDWLSDTCHRLLVGGAHEVILPYDFGTRNKAKCEMVGMMNGRENLGNRNIPPIAPPHKGIHWGCVQAEHNPLWVASDTIEIEEEMAGIKNLAADNTSVTKRFCHPETPFVVVTAVPSSS